MSDSVYRQAVGASRPDPLSGCTARYAEEEWVDWVLGTVAGPRRAEMRAHLEVCPSCRQLSADWERVLLYPGLQGDPEAGTAGDLEQVQPVIPAERVRKSLRWRVRLIALRNRTKEFIRGSFRRRGAILAFSFALIVAGGWLLRTEHAADEPWSTYVERYEPAALPVMSSPESIALPLDGGRLTPESGMVWYNEASREMLMLVGGIVPREDQIVEVWAVKEGNRDSLGLLQYHAYRAHLYVKNKEALQEADNLVLTVETRNADPEDPAPKDTIFVDLTAGRK